MYVVNKSLIFTRIVFVIGSALFVFVLFHLFVCLFACLLLDCKNTELLYYVDDCVYDFRIACTSHWFTGSI